MPLEALYVVVFVVLVTATFCFATHYVGKTTRRPVSSLALRDPRLAQQSDIIYALATLWYRNPELRLGQLLHDVRSVEPTAIDPFYQFDSDLARQLNKALDR